MYALTRIIRRCGNAKAMVSSSGRFVRTDKAGAGKTGHQRIQASLTKPISEHTKRWQGKEALRLYKEMLQEGVAPSSYALIAALKACSTITDLEAGKQIHAYVIQSGNLPDLYLATSLVSMYVKCGSMVDASQVFENMPHRDVVSWNAMIMGYAQIEKGDLALQLYARMQHQGFAPNGHTFVALLKACSSVAEHGATKKADVGPIKIRCLQKGRAIHSQVTQTGLQSDIFVATALVAMYVKCGSMVDAHQVFEKMPHRDVVSWTAMIMGYAQMEKGDSALQLYARMQHEGFIPNDHTFVAALKACASLAAHEEAKEVNGQLMKIGCLEKGRTIHSQVAKSGFEFNVLLANTLVDMYAKCGSMVDARQVFEKMMHRTVVSWNTMIIGYANIEMGDSALQLYARMQHEGFVPDDRTFAAVLKACVSLAAHEEVKEGNGEFIKIKSLEKGRAIHCQLVKSGFESNVFVANTLIDMYAKCGSMVDALQVFEGMMYRTVVSWTAMITGYAQMEMGVSALELYARMQHEGFAPNDRTFVAALKACSSLAIQEQAKDVDGEPVKIRCLEKGRAIHSQVTKSGLEADIFVATALVAMYMKCGSMVRAYQVFEKMLHRTVVSWNAMISGYAEMEKGDIALQLYERMQHEGFRPDAYTFVAALKACGSLASLGIGTKIHAEICKVGLEGEAIVVACLVDMYGKCGSMVDAQRLFDAFLVKDVVTWSALIAGYSGQGDCECVFDLFERMQQESILPDGVTFLSVLSVCGHTGLVDKGQKYFQVMCSDYRIAPHSEHYSCMVDLLGRAGQLDEAVAVVKKMPFEPVRLMWMTILGACRKWNNVEVGRHAFECIVRLDGKYAAAYVVMTNIYVSAHMWEESSRIQEMRMDAQAWRKPGQCWWTDNTGVVHTFPGGERNHPKSKDTYAKLRDLFVKMEEEGCAPDLQCVLHSISEDEKEDVLCGHSEKLAIAFALVNTPPRTIIRIAKNLCVCNDCHNTIAFISRIEQRTIICRDANRFHVYKNGKCSCGDFW